jgi:hypothetical protein
MCRLANAIALLTLPYFEAVPLILGNYAYACFAACGVGQCYMLQELILSLISLSKMYTKGRENKFCCCKEKYLKFTFRIISAIMILATVAEFASLPVYWGDA